MIEVYKIVNDFPNYQISNYGNIKSFNIFKKPTLMKQETLKSGHKRIRICQNSKILRILVHRLVLKTFLMDCPEGMVGCHNDGNPSNNRIDNLRWDTMKNNTADRKKHGTHHVGEQTSNAKLKECEVIEVRRLRGLKVPIIVVAKMFKMSRRSISSMCNGETWNSVLNRK